MLVKRFVPKTLMQQNQHSSMLDDIAEVVLRLGYFLLNPTFSNAVAGISTEQVGLHNLFFYHSTKMKFKERVIANRLTVALQEALIQNELLDIRGYGSKVQYSKLYGCSYTWVDIPNVQIKYKWKSNSQFDYSSYVVFKGLSSRVYSQLKTHDFYLDEFNQAIKSVKDCDLLTPKLNNKGFLVYPLVDNTVDDRLIIKNVTNLKMVLASYKDFRIPLTPSIEYDPTKYANILLAGEIGGGKSYACVALACEFALRDYQISIIDGKDADLAYFGDTFLPDGRTATTGESALKLLREYVKDMDSQYTKMKKIRNKSPEGHILTDFRAFGFKPRMLFVDEFASILTQLDNKQAKEATDLLKQLILKNRQAGYFVCVSTQQPNAKIIDTDVRDNLMLRIFMGSPKDEVKKMVFGSGVNLPALLVGKGVGYVQFGRSDVQCFRAPTLPAGKMELYRLVKECMKTQKS